MLLRRCINQTALCFRLNNALLIVLCILYRIYKKKMIYLLVRIRICTFRELASYVLDLRSADSFNGLQGVWKQQNLPDAVYYLRISLLKFQNQIGFALRLICFADSNHFRIFSDKDIPLVQDTISSCKSIWKRCFQGSSFFFDKRDER